MEMDRRETRHERCKGLAFIEVPGGDGTDHEGLRCMREAGHLGECMAWPEGLEGHVSAWWDMDEVRHPA